jgi:hypothetical protein
MLRNVDTGNELTNDSKGVCHSVGTRNLFGVTQEVDMVTTRASNFGRFVAAVLEPDAIPTKLDVIIGNRYFQLTFEVEPYLPNIGLRSKWITQNEGNDDRGNCAAKDIEMKEAENNGNTNISNASVGNTETNHKTRNNVPEA